MCSGKRAFNAFSKSLFFSILFASAVFAATKDIPPHGAAIVLFNGRDLSGFDTFFKSKGLNSDPDQVFQVENGIIHVSGMDMDYIITKQGFQNYYLKAEFK